MNDTATAPKKKGKAEVEVRKQRTIAKLCEISGIGLHSGETTTVRIKPAEAGAGVVFVRTDIPGYARVPALVKYRTEILRRTALKKGEAEVHTIEHLLSAACGLGLDNLEIEIDGVELPGLDGSAGQYVELLQDAGVVEQDAECREIVVREPISVSHGGASLVAMPYDGLRISYTLDYPGDALPSMYHSYEFSTAERYAQDIAPARTYVLKREAEMLLAAGMGKGANTDNTVVIGDDGQIAEGEMRFADEPVRHKILDCLGDLALAGAPVRAHLIAVKSGHELNADLVRALIAREEDSLAERAAEGGVAFDIREITRILPHRYPFLLVDRIIELGPQRAVGIKNVTFNEPFFQGHFPGQPVMPGVLLIEAGAQVTGAMLLGTREHAGKLAYLLGVDSFKFRKTVTPGDRVVIETEALRIKERTGQARVKATVDNHVVCEGVIKFMLIDATGGEGGASSE